MASKFVYLTSSAAGSVAVHHFGQTFDFDAVPHEMRLNELVYNKSESVSIGPDECRLLLLIPNNNSDDINSKQWIENKAKQENRECEPVTSYTGYSNSLMELCPKHFKADSITKVSELVDKMNRFLNEITPRWSVWDSVPMVTGNEKITIIPGFVHWKKAKIYVIPVFGSVVRDTLSLHAPESDEFKASVEGFMSDTTKGIQGGTVSQRSFQNHFYFMMCNLVHNTINEGMTDYGLLFSWLKDPTKVSKINHVKNESDCWIPVKKSKFDNMKIIILDSNKNVALFEDDFTLAQIEIRPRKWKEQCT